ncbi:MerR HTH family regulatory protein [Mycolicibacterium rutilum]|uniref:MerR HTH family regulatory protein n=1 Tax=Mycolicibacterium rutilum TaxID=370526 RepID=A0A1H6LQB2_MYCRU|nr:MerR family transcriptional regulator [Mycolicibacterium rutilum]SEH86950.1 MerR HTH family regulatory protein [Mycolicibacterium rutilum]
MSDADQPKYTVRVVAERVGVPTATLRSWSQRYGIGPSQHTPGTHRLYSENDVKAVQRMHELIRDGVSRRSAAQLAGESIMPPRGDIDALLTAALDLNLLSLGRLLESHLQHFGVLDTWELVVRPAYAAIVSRQEQQGGCVDVEHALSWAVARTLQRAPLAPAGADTSVVLACTARETHVLPLEALRAALGERGHGAVMLGADVPAWAMIDAIARLTTPVTAVLWSHTRDTADIDTVRAVSRHAQVLLGGPGWDHVPQPAPGVRVTSLRDALHRWERSA